MRVTPLVRREFALLVRSKWLWLLAIPVFWVGNNHLTSGSTKEPWLAIAASSSAVTIVSFIAIIVCFRSIIGERESGSIRITAGTPLSRTELLVGTALGRGFAMALPVGLGVFAITSLSWARYGTPALGALAGFLVVALLVIIVYSGLVTALSAVSSSTVRAVAISTAVIWLLGDGSSLFTTLYELAIGHPINGLNPPSDPVYFLIRRLFPLNAYRAVVNSLLGLPNTDEYFVTALQATNSGQTGFAVTQVFGPNPPFYLTPWFAFLTLLLWAVLPVSLAAVRFQHYDLTTLTGDVRSRLARYVPLLLHRTWTRLGRIPFTVFTTLVNGTTNGHIDQDWIPIARREFAVKDQSLGTPILFGLSLITVFWQLNMVLPVAHRKLGPNVTLAAFQFPVAILGMLGTFFLGFRSIVYERESGAIRHTVGTPISRKNVVLGKIVALVFAVGTPILYVLAIGSVVGILQNGFFSLTAFLGFLFAVIVYLCLNAALFIGVSTVVSTSTRAAALGFGYLLVTLMWPFIHRSAYGLFVGPSYPFSQPPPDMAYFFTRRLFPRQLFYVLSNWATGVANSSTEYPKALLIEQAAADPTRTLFTHGLVTNVAFDAHPVPFILKPWFAIVLIGAWIFGLVAVTTYRFRAIDLT